MWSVRRAVLAFAIIACTPTSIDSARWWDSPRFVAALDLTLPQRAAIDLAYQDTFVERRALAARANAARALVNRLMDDDASEAEVEAAVTVAADADAAHRRLRTLMLYRMLRALTPQQRRRLATVLRQNALDR